MTTPPGQGHPGGTDNEQDDLPDPPGTEQTPESNQDDDSDGDDDCLSGTFVSGDCQSRPEGDQDGSDDQDGDGVCTTDTSGATVEHRHSTTANGMHTDCQAHTPWECIDTAQNFRPGHLHGPVRIPPCDGGEAAESTDTSSQLPTDVVIDGQTVADVVGSAEVSALCQTFDQLDLTVAADRRRSVQIADALRRFGYAVICEDGAAPIWHYAFDGDTSTQALAEFGINVGLEIVCGAITAGTVAAATAATTPLGGALAGTAVAITCSDAAGQVAVWVVESVDFLVQRLSECDDIPDDAAASITTTFNPYGRYANIGRCLIHSDGTDVLEDDQQPTQPQSRITETPPVCARIEGDWLEATWDEISAQSMSRLRWWVVSWSVVRSDGATITTGDHLLATNVQQHRFVKPGWVSDGGLADADWRVDVIASAGVGGFEPWASQRVTSDGGWAGSSGVGEC